MTIKGWRSFTNFYWNVKILISQKQMYRQIHEIFTDKNYTNKSDYTYLIVRKSLMQYEQQIIRLEIVII